MSSHPSGRCLPLPTDRITDLIERDAIFEPYYDLTSEGSDVHGLTKFCPNEKPVVYIDKRLYTGGREHRLRTTLAHEWGHVALHDGPFQEKSATGSLFDSEVSESAKCRRDNIFGAPKVDWMEWQAAYVCGSLLMPKTFVLEATSRYCDKYRCHGKILAGTGYPGQLAEQISKEFQVSQAAALVRITQLGLVQSKSSNLSFI